MQYTTGYQPHTRTEAPGTLIYRSPTPELGGRLTNIIYHQGWLMAGFENPGSDNQANDLRFRVMDISNLENNPVPVPYWPSDFGLDYGTNHLGREHWYTGNWGYHTHGHGRTATHVHWNPLRVPDFGGAVYQGMDSSVTRFNWGWRGIGGGRLRRHLPWMAADDWSYSTDNDPVIYLSKAWLDDPNGPYNANNYTSKPIAQIPGGNEGVRGFADLLGDTFFVLSDQRDSGVAIYRVDDSLLLNYDENATIPTMQLLGSGASGFGGYWPEFWASRDGRLYVVNVANEIHVVDVTDFSNPQMHRVLDEVNGTQLRIRNAVYPKFQDDLLLIENVVIDMQKLVDGDADPVVLELQAPPYVDGWRNGFDPSQFSFPLGNLIVTGGYGSITGGMFIHVRQQAPDTTRPEVRYHIPQRDRSNYSRVLPISILIHEELDSRTLNNGVNFMVRKVVDSEPVGDPVDMLVNLGSNNVLNLTPVEPLEENTTYQVDLPSNNGLMDISGNRIVEYSWRFSTGSTVEPPQPIPSIVSFTANTLKLEPGQSFQGTAIVEDSSAFEYRVDPGDGSGYGNWIPLAAGEHSLPLTQVYTTAGRYKPRIQVRDNFDQPVSASLDVLVLNEAMDSLPTRSSPILVASDGRVWVVNPDADSVSVLAAGTGQFLAEYPVGTDPRGLAEDALGRIWVTCMDSDEVIRLRADGSQLDRLALPYGTAPFAIVASPDQSRMYVSAFGSGLLYEFDVQNPAQVLSLPLGPTPRALAVQGDQQRLYVSRFISAQNYGEVWSVDLQDRSVSSIRLDYDNTVDGSNDGSGVPNYLNGLALSPQGDSLVVVGKKDNTFKGSLFGSDAPTHEHTVRTTLAVIDVATQQEVVAARRDFDNADSPSATSFTPDGSMLFTAIQGNNQVQVLDAVGLQDAVSSTAVLVLKNTGDPDLIPESPSGLAPQGLVFDSARNRLYSMNFMSRSVTVFDVQPALQRNEFTFTRVLETSTVTQEPLSDDILLGKQLFYNASDLRMSSDSYISCATCHVNGGHDGRVWDFSDRGEGLRNTIDLRGRAGTGHGNVHWSANFDEIHDFELDIVNNFQGEGFTQAVGGPHASLGESNAGRSAHLDALVAYVTSLDRSHLPRSPHREADGAPSQLALRGSEVFIEQNCYSCHDPTRGFTNSRVGNGSLHDVGTLRDSSGLRLGSTLPGIDTPTLLGLWDGAPFLHDGSAAELSDVFKAHGGTQYPAEDAQIQGAERLQMPLQTDVKFAGALEGMLLFADVGDRVDFSNLPGSPTPGPSSISLRYRAEAAVSLNLTLNAQTQLLQLPATEGEWREYPLSGLMLSSGLNNTLTLQLQSGVFALDHITLASAAAVEAADPHQRVMQISQQDRDALLQYLKELDGSAPPIRPMAPLVTRHPEDQFAYLEASAVFSVGELSEPPAQIQWQFRPDRFSAWQTLTGATGTQLELQEIAAGDAGHYRALLSNEHGQGFSEAGHLFVGPTTAVAPMPGDALVAAWLFDEGQGTQAVNSVNAAHSGAMGAAAWAQGQLGSAVDLSGGSVQVPAGLDLVGNQFTMSFWMRPGNNGGTDPRILSKASGTSTTAHLWKVGFTGNRRFRVRLTTADGFFELSSNEQAFAYDQWQHVAVVYDGAQLRIHKDGVNIASRAASGVVAVDPSLGVGIGNQPTGAGDRAYDGLLDQIRIYNRALTAEELQLLQEEPAAPELDPEQGFRDYLDSLDDPPPHSFRGLLDDPDLDGLPSLLEFAMGTHANRHDTAVDLFEMSQLPLPNEDAEVRISYEKRVPGLFYIVEMCTRLTDPDWSPVSDVEEFDAASGMHFRRTRVPASQSDVFFRMRVQMP